MVIFWFVCEIIDWSLTRQEVWVAFSLESVSGNIRGISAIQNNFAFIHFSACVFPLSSAYFCLSFQYAPGQSIESLSASASHDSKHLLSNVHFQDAPQSSGGHFVCARVCVCVREREKERGSHCRALGSQWPISWCRKSAGKERRGLNGHFKPSEPRSWLPQP